MTSTINQYVPDVVSPPGATLQDILDDRGISQAELATHMGRPRKTINEIIKAKTELTSETALQLERVLHVPASFWVRREADYREFLARKKDNEALAKQVGWLKKVPARAMVKAGWIPPAADRAGLLREVLRFFNVASPEGLGDLRVLAGAAFRKSNKLKSDPYALAAWLKRGEVLAARAEVVPFSASVFKEKLAEARRLSTRPAAGDLVGLCAAAGVVLLVVPEIRGARASGAARWLGGRPVIQLSLRHGTDDHFWFTFFHEAAHILLHKKADVFVDEDDGHADAREGEANKFAAEWLIPESSLMGFLQGGNVTEPSIRAFAESVGVAPGVVVGRLQHDGHLKYGHFQHLKRAVAASEFSMPSAERV